MDSVEVERIIKTDSDLCPFVMEVAEEAAEYLGESVSIQPIEGSIRFPITGLDMLFCVAAYTLYRLVRDAFDNRRALADIDIAKQQIKLIATLRKLGYTPKQAEAVVTALLKKIKERAEDDPILKKAVSLFCKHN